MSALNRTLSVGVRRISNSVLNRALSISFEITRSCNAKCKHCHLRGTIPEEELEELEDIIETLRKHKKKYNTVIASEYTFTKMLEYFKNLTVGNCRAGEKFLIVNLDATLSPCGLHMGNYTSQKEIITDFLKNNTCGNCMTSIRANTEKPFKYQIKDALRAARRSQ